MIISIRLFAGMRQHAGAELIMVELPQPATVGMLRDALTAGYPELAEVIRRSSFALDQNYAADSEPIAENTAVACIPPVSGG